jgi:hypothetical protein
MGCWSAKPTPTIANRYNTFTAWDCCKDRTGLRKLFT